MAVRGTQGAAPGQDSFFKTSDIPTGNVFTVCGWLCPTGFNTWNLALSFGGTSAGQPSCALGRYSGAFVLDCTQNGQVAFSTVAVNDVIFAAMVCGDGTKLKGYLLHSPAANAFDAVVFTADAPTYTLNDLRVGTSCWDGTDYWSGRMWNIKCWSRALSAAELMIEARYERVKFPQNLHLHWPMSHASDTRDLSGNNRTPTIVATPATEPADWQPWKPRARIIQYAAAAQGYVGIENKLYGVDARGLGHMVRR